MNEPLLKLSGIEKCFTKKGWGRQRFVHALRPVSLNVLAGKSVGLVGESGSGKTTLARIVMGLETPSGGTLALRGREYPKRPRDMRRLLAREVQMVFQDPKSSLNPRKTAEHSLMAPLLALTDLSKSEQRRRVRELVQLVDLSPETLARYPHQLSGGQAQRLAIARALAPRPSLLLLDEALASLDVSVQARVLRLLHRLKQRLGLSYLFITHDLGTVEVLCDEIAVMYLGSVVEFGPARTVLSSPKHPYTRALLSALPRLGEHRVRISLPGEPPSPANPPSGCAFHPRCHRAEQRCVSQVPALDDGAVDHPCACFFANESAPSESSPE